jgi:hypothetical protein
LAFKLIFYVCRYYETSWGSLCIKKNIYRIDKLENLKLWYCISLSEVIQYVLHCYCNCAYVVRALAANCGQKSIGWAWFDCYRRLGFHGCWTLFCSLCSLRAIMEVMINKLTERASPSSSPQTTGSSFFIKDILSRYELLL